MIALTNSSVAPQRTVHAKRAHLIHALAIEIAAATAVPAHDSLAYTAASSLLGAYCALAREYDRRRDTGQDPAEICLVLQAEAARVFDLFEDGDGYAPAHRFLDLDLSMAQLKGMPLWRARRSVPLGN